MKHERRPICLLVSLIVAFSAQASWSRGPEKNAAKPSKSQKVVERWLEKMKAIDEMILDGRSPRALTDANKLAFEMIDKIESGDGVGGLLGRLNVLRALAAANVGDESQALWHWHIGLQMFPEIAHFDFSAYGEAGRLLRDHPLRKYGQEAGSGEEVGELEGISPPRKTKAPAPRFPAAKRHGSKPLVVIVQAIIDEEGHVREPLIKVAEGGLTLVCVTLEALRQWEFEPATINGKPVAVPYNLTMVFHPLS